MTRSLVLATSLAASVPAAARPIETPCGAAAGDVLTYRTEHHVQRPPNRPGAAGVERHGEAGLTVTIDEVVAGEIALTARFAEGTGSMEPALQAAMDQLVAEGFDASQPPAHLRFNAVARAATVVNVEDWVAYAQRSFDALAPHLQAANPQQTPETLASARAMIASPAIATAEPNRFVTPLVSYWCAHFASPTVRYEGEQPNPLGGAPLTTTGVTRVRRTKSGIVLHIEESSSVDASAWIKAMVPESTAKDQVDALMHALLKLQRRSVTDVTVDPVTGLVSRFSTRSEVGSEDGDGVAVDEVTIERQR